MTNALIYATTLLTKGNADVAKYIASYANSDIFDLKELSTLNLGIYDSIIVGTANNGGKADKMVTEFVQKNQSSLEGKKRCLYVLSSKDDEKSTEQAKAIGQELGFQDVFLIPKKRDSEGFTMAVEKMISSL
jgi:menaquinone-dependent protoporphyrinogen IX oxidase